MTTRYTDLMVRQDDEGIWDLVLDEEAGDFTLDAGLEPAIIVSLFSDRRAASDEVADPLKRRGWIGNVVAEVPGDNFGSGLWLYEQRRLTGEVVAGVRSEGEQALDWMVDEGLCSGVTAKIVAVPANRQVLLAIDLETPADGITSRAYRLADETRRGVVARLGAV